MLQHYSVVFARLGPVILKAMIPCLLLRRMSQRFPCDCILEGLGVLPGADLLELLLLFVILRAGQTCRSHSKSSACLSLLFHVSLFPWYPAGSTSLHDIDADGLRHRVSRVAAFSFASAVRARATTPLNNTSNRRPLRAGRGFGGGGGTSVKLSSSTLHILQGRKQ